MAAVYRLPTGRGCIGSSRFGTGGQVAGLRLPIAIRMNRHLASVLALAVAVSLRAQDPPPAPTEPRDQGTADSRDQARLEERARSMREHIDTGKQVKSHVRISVRFKNGNKLVGVVKDGRFVERVDGLRFVDAQAQDRGAGIRLWYTSGVRNFVFVPFADLADYQVLQRLTAQQLDEMEREMQLQEGRRAEREAEIARAAAAAKAQAANDTPVGETVDGSTDTPPAPGQEPAPSADAKSKAGGKTGKDGAVEGADKKGPVTDEQRAWFALLQAYPPQAGWGKARRDEIARRLAVIGAKPSEMEQRFVDQFAEWEKACQHFGVDQTKEEAEQQAAEEAAKNAKNGKSDKRDRSSGADKSKESEAPTTEEKSTSKRSRKK